MIGRWFKRAAPAPVYTPDDVIMYAQQMLFAAVCVPKDMTPRQIETLAPPSGTTRGWRVNTELTFKSGEPSPCPCSCNNRPGDRLHYLLECW